MEEMMSGMMKQEDMPHMTAGMFKQLTKEDRIAFMQNMMPRCISMMFAELDADARRSLASAMLERVADVLHEQIDDSKEPNPI